MDAVHKEIVELIPWYVNGTLPKDEHAGVEKHVNECLPCRAALREAQRIRSLVSGHDDVPIGMEHGFSDLLRRIDGRAVRRSPFRPWPRLAYGAAAVCVAIAGWLLVAGLLAPGTTDRAPFTTLTDGASGADTRIDIVFADATPEADILGIIDSVGGHLVTGPSALGRYTVVVETTTPDELSRLIERLTEDPRVRFAGQNYIASPTTEVDEP
jgi:anti-sigma factor RsiW